MRLNRIPVLVISAITFSCSEPTSIIVEPLRIINWSPASGATCVEVTTTVAATFSDDLVPESVTADSFYLLSSEGKVPVTLQYEQAAFTVRLTPTAPLAFDRLYAAVATVAIKGKEQGRLTAEIEVPFMTVARSGCVPGQPECLLPSDCPSTQICSIIGTCIDECVTDRDCYHARCDQGTCVPETQPDGGGDDGAGGDPGGGDPGAGDGGDPGVDGGPDSGDSAGDPGAGDGA